MGRTRDVSKILTSNTSILTLASASTTYQTIAKTGLIELTPSTISVSGGSGSVSSTGAVSFTSASAISLNGVFSSSYENYKIMIKASQSAAEWFAMRMRLSGTDATTSAYNFSLLRGTPTDSTSGTTTMGYISQHTSGNANKRMSLDVYNPFDAANTFVVSTGLTVTPVVGLMSFEHQVATSYDGFTLLSQAGATITGLVSVYGYNK